MHKINLVSLVGALALLSACAHQAPKQVESVSSATTPAAVNMAAAENASHVADIKFQENSSELSEEARRTLVSMIDSAQTSGVMAEVKVLAWADKDYPAVNTKKLAKGERDLAAERADKVRGFIKSLFTVKDIDTYNMAKRPNTIERLFRTDDARLKRAMEQAGIPNSASLARANSSKASHAVVMVITK